MSRPRKPVPDALADWSPRRIAAFFAKYERAVEREQREELPENRRTFLVGPNYAAVGYRLAIDERYRIKRKKET